jgi:hypothetical protein
MIFLQYFLKASLSLWIIEWKQHFNKKSEKERKKKCLQPRKKKKNWKKKHKKKNIKSMHANNKFECTRI